jgi:hypothetical protein
LPKRRSHSTVGDYPVEGGAVVADRAEYERIQDRRLEAWFAFEERRWQDAAAGFQVVIDALRRLRRVPVNVNLIEEIAQAMELRAEALSHLPSQT